MLWGHQLKNEQTNQYKWSTIFSFQLFDFSFKELWISGQMQKIKLRNLVGLSGIKFLNVQLINWTSVGGSKGKLGCNGPGWYFNPTRLGNWRANPVAAPCLPPRKQLTAPKLTRLSCHPRYPHNHPKSKQSMALFINYSVFV